MLTILTHGALHIICRTLRRDLQEGYQCPVESALVAFELDEEEEEEEEEGEEEKVDVVLSTHSLAS